MATKVKRGKGGYLVSQLVGATRKKRVWRAAVLVPYGDDEALNTELVRQAEESRSLALPGGVK